MGPRRLGTDGRLPRVIGAQHGFTLVELLIAMALALVVVVGPLVFLITSIRQQNVVSSRTFASRQAETGLEQLTRDLREAMTQDASGNPLSVTVSNPTSATTAISFYIPTPNSSTVQQAITWTCPSAGASSVGKCTRAIGSVTATQIVGVKSATFSPLDSSGATLALPTLTSPSYIGISLSVQVTSQLDPSQTRVAQGASNPITVQGGVDLRNQA